MNKKGWNRYAIINQDCILAMQEIEDNEIDMVLTSPPYDSLRAYHGIEWNESIWKSVIKELYRIVKPGAVVVWVVGDATIKGSETLTSFKQALWARECGFNLHDTMIYEKSGFSNPSNNRYHQIFEYMFVFSKDNPKTFNSIKDRVNIYKTGGGASYRTKDGAIIKTGRATKRDAVGQRFNIWRYPTGGGHMSSDNSKHPAQFPEKLAHDHILSWSNEDDIVLDCFAGSGTTLVAALNLNRRAIGIEISTEYCDIIRGRIEKISESEGTV